MATASITYQPIELQPVGNEIICVLDSNFKTRPNFNFITDVSVGGNNVAQIKSPIGISGETIIDLSSKIKPELSRDFNPDLVTFSQAVNSYSTYSISVDIEFRDEWRFDDNFFNSGFVGFRGATESYFSPGDEITIEQDAGFTNPEYQGRATVTSAGYSASLAGGSYFIITDKSFQSSTPAEPGTASLANFGLTRLASTASFTGDKIAFNGCLVQDDWVDYDFNDYRILTSTSSLLTELPQTGYKVGLNSGMWLNFYQNSEIGGTAAAEWLIFRTDGGLYRIQNTAFTSPSTTITDRLLQIACGPDTLSSSGYTPFSTSRPTAFESTTTWYEFYLAYYVGPDPNKSYIASSKTYRVDIDTSCSRYETFELLFQDRFGSIIPVIFKRASRVTQSQLRQFYDKTWGTWTGTEWQKDLQQHAKSQSSNRLTKRYTCYTDWLTQTQSDFISELISSSPRVWWRDESGTVRAIFITTSDIEFKKIDNDGIININVEFEISMQNRTL